MSYFFLYPLGHLGFTVVTFLVNLPFMQVIVVLFDDGVGVGVGETLAVEFLSLSWTLITPEE